MPDEPYITDDHLVGFGMIINHFAGLEFLLEVALAAMLDISPAKAGPLMSALRYEQKRDLARAFADASIWPPSVKNEFHRLTKRLDTKNALRRSVAHAVWRKGRKAGHIKPIDIRARGQIKTLGLGHNEKEYSAAALQSAGVEMRKLWRDMLMFMSQNGLDKNIPR